MLGTNCFGMTRIARFSPSHRDDAGDPDQPIDPQLEEKRRRQLQTLTETACADLADPVSPVVVTRAYALETRLAKPPSWLDRAAAVILAPLVDSGPQVVLGLRGGTPRQCTLGDDKVRLDFEIEAANDSHGEALAIVRGQLDTEPALAGAVHGTVLHVATGAAVCNIETDDNGRFDCELPSGTYEFVFQLNGNQQAIGRIELP